MLGCAMIAETRLRQEKDLPAGTATKNSVHTGSIEVAGAKRTRKWFTNICRYQSNLPLKPALER